jgi:hypothetical protein
LRKKLWMARVILAIDLKSLPASNVALLCDRNGPVFRDRECF